MPTKPTVYTFLTKTGRAIRVRPLDADDAPYLVDLFENMSQDSRYRRFMQSLEHVDMERVWSEAEQIARGTAINSYGLLAFCDTTERPDVPVAGARYVRTDAGEAEIAVSVRDDMQGMGIGTHLLRLLVDEARREGIDRLVAMFQNENFAVWSMLKKLDGRLVRRSNGTEAFITLYLNEQPDMVDTAAEYLPELQLIG